MLPEKLWRLARLTLNRLVPRIRQQKLSGASIDRVIDVEQAREQSKAAWLDQVSKRAPYLLAQVRTYPQTSQTAPPRPRPTVRRVMPQPRPRASSAAQTASQGSRPESPQNPSLVSSGPVLAGPATSLPLEVGEKTFKPPPHSDRKRPTPTTALTATTGSLPEERPFFDKQIDPLPGKDSAGDDLTDKGLFLKLKNSRSMHDLGLLSESVREPVSKGCVDVPKQDVKDAAGPPVEINTGERPRPEAAYYEMGNSGNNASKAWANLPLMEHEVPGPETRPKTAPMARPPVPVSDTRWPQEEVPVADVAPPPSIFSAAEGWQPGESLSSSVPENHWPPLLPDQQQDTYMTPRSLWNESEYRRRLLDEQRGV